MLFPIQFPWFNSAGELLQNSDDAKSTTVEIYFETKEFANNKQRESSSDHSDENLPDLKTAPVHKWTFRNNGIVFRSEDWARLKKIADGNPDPERIGAFGVGKLLSRCTTHE